MLNIEGPAKFARPFAVLKLARPVGWNTVLTEQGNLFETIFDGPPIAGGERAIWFIDYYW